MTFLALRDGTIEVDPRLFPHARANPNLAARLLGAPSLPAAVEVPVWAYLIDAPEGPVLIDAGGGALLGPRLGGVAVALKAAGVAARDIRRVCLTHLHGDHCGGLLANDDAAFPNARIAVSKAEHAFWTSPDLGGGLFSISRDARTVLAPYVGRIDLIEPGFKLGSAHAVSAAGHTPGHLAWMFETAGLLACGDIVHLPELQMERPDWSSDWDQDPGSAAATREELLQRVRSEGLTLLCAHGRTIVAQ